MEEQIEKIKTNVERILKNHPITRNCDKWLVLMTLKEMGFIISYNVDDIAEMPSFETITRIRREFQNKEGKYRADEEIEEIREVKREDMRIRYNTGINLDKFRFR